MFKRITFLLIFVLFSVALTPVSAIGGDTTSIPGHIALVGADYNVYTYDFAEDMLSSLSQDASRTRHYQWPTWSNDGRIAYFCCDVRVTQNLAAQVYISSNGLDSGELVYEAPREAVIYAYWSPANCTDSANCRDLALLVNDIRRGGLSIEMLRNDTSGTTNRTIDSGSPFYYHWNPDGTQLLFHRNNARIDIFDLAQNDLSMEFDQPSSGLFQAPGWSPVDNRILFGVQGDDRFRTNLVVMDGDNLQTLIPDLRGFVSFLWSPDGNYIAYRVFNRDGIGPVVVVDSRTGEEVSHSELDGIIAFFWSPDSTKIAYLTVADEESQSMHAQQQTIADTIPVQGQSPVEFAWSVLDIELGTNVRYISFAPTYEMSYLIQYFDQFSPSHRLWSPDSRYLVYSGLVNVDGSFQPQVRVIDINQPNDASIVISDGVFGVWSFE